MCTLGNVKLVVLFHQPMKGHWAHTHAYMKENRWLALVYFIRYISASNSPECDLVRYPRLPEMEPC